MGQRRNYRAEVRANFRFEQESQPRANKLYIEKGYSIARVDGKENKLYDVKLYKNGTCSTVEEKFLRQDADFMFVEIMQDVNTGDPGWIDYTMAEFLFYMMPSATYVCKMSNLKKFIRYYGDRLRTIYSNRGYGKTKNKALPFVIIVENEIGKRVI